MKNDSGRIKPAVALSTTKCSMWNNFKGSVVMPKKKTEAQREYTKQLSRIKKFVKRATARGYEFAKNIIPKTPKRITQASLNKLKKMTPESLYKKATFKTFENGKPKTVSGTEGRKIERSRASRKSAATRQAKRDIATKQQRAIERQYYKNEPPRLTDMVLRNVEDMISSWEAPINQYARAIKEKDHSRLSRILNGQILQLGRDVVAQRLEANADRVLYIVNRVLYSSDEPMIDNYLVEFANIIKGDSLTMEESAELTQQGEFFEDFMDVDNPYE